MLPELLEANGLLSANVPSDRLAFELTSHRLEVASLDPDCLESFYSVGVGFVVGLMLRRDEDEDSTWLLTSRTTDFERSATGMDSMSNVNDILGKAGGGK